MGAKVLGVHVLLLSVACAFDFTAFIQNNKRSDTGLPLSYYVPTDYFPNIPESERPHDHTKPLVIPQCKNKTVQPDALNKYEFQTEGFLSQLGVNLYDAAMWQIASMLLGMPDQAKKYEDTVLLEHKTAQLANIKADKPCVNIVYPYGPCHDPDASGACGLCYGEDLKSLDTTNAYFFRMISDVYALKGTLDARCPEQGTEWVWNDWKPITGENSWASITGPLQLAYHIANGNVDAIPDDGTALTLATQYIVALQAMQIKSLGAIYYAPYNTWGPGSPEPDIGDQVSVENNVSTLGALRMLYEVIMQKSSSTHKALLPAIEELMKGIEKYIQSAWYAEGGYFHQGGAYNRDTDTFKWVTEPFFAVDCQTWTMTVLGSKVIDGWFGTGSTLNLWNVTKKIGGYKYDASTGMARGLGYSNNEQEQVFSGEWSLGGANALRVIASEMGGSVGTALMEEAAAMRQAVDDDLHMTAVYNGQPADALQYSSKRYYIPFGWWANPIPSQASTAWAVAMDKNFNPFRLGGNYTVVPLSS